MWWQSCTIVGCSRIFQIPQLQKPKKMPTFLTIVSIFIVYGLQRTPVCCTHDEVQLELYKLKFTTLKYKSSSRLVRGITANHRILSVLPFPNHFAFVHC